MKSNIWKNFLWKLPRFVIFNLLENGTWKIKIGGNYSKLYFDIQVL